MALSDSEPLKVSEEIGSGSSESSDDAVGVCRIRPLTATACPKKRVEKKPSIEENNGNYDDDDDDKDELIIDEDKAGEPTVDRAQDRKKSYERQVSTPLKKRKLPLTEDTAPVSICPAEEKPTAVDISTFGLPLGWKRKVTERMSGASAGKFDVYLTSPQGKRLRSMKEVCDHLEKTKSPFKKEDFIFKPPNLKSQATPASIKSPSKTPATKKAVKRASSATRKELSKKKKADEKVKKAKERKKRTPIKSAILQKKKGKEPRLVRKPPPEKASVKASKQQKFQKLLVKINFQQKGGEDSDLDSDEEEEEEEEDSFDEGSEPEEEMEVPQSPPRKSPRSPRSPRGVRNSLSE